MTKANPVAGACNDEPAQTLPSVPCGSCGDNGGSSGGAIVHDDTLAGDATADKPLGVQISGIAGNQLQKRTKAEAGNNAGLLVLPTPNNIISVYYNGQYTTGPGGAGANIILQCTTQDGLFPSASDWNKVDAIIMRCGVYGDLSQFGSSSFAITVNNSAPSPKFNLYPYSGGGSYLICSEPDNFGSVTWQARRIDSGPNRVAGNLNQPFIGTTAADFGNRWWLYAGAIMWLSSQNQYQATPQSLWDCGYFGNIQWTADAVAMLKSMGDWAAVSDRTLANTGNEAYLTFGQVKALEQIKTSSGNPKYKIGCRFSRMDYGINSGTKYDTRQGLAELVLLMTNDGMADNFG